MEKQMQQASLRSTSWPEASVHYYSATLTRSSLLCKCCVWHQIFLLLSLVLITCFWTVYDVIGSEQCSTRPASSCCFYLSILTFHFLPIHPDPRCTMRIGKGIHPDGVPGWCQGFSLDGGSGVRAVKVIQHGNRPGLIYNIGKLLHSKSAQMNSIKLRVKIRTWETPHE